MPDHSQPFQIKMDASKYATGAVLSQLDSNSDRHPVVFYSKTFSPAKRNYDIHDRELLAIVRGRSASSDVSSDISPSPLYIPPHRR